MSMVPTVLLPGSQHTWTLPVPAWAQARQLTLSFQACGGWPMRDLGFSFLGPDGAVVHAVRAHARDAPACHAPAHARVSRLRARLSLAGLKLVARRLLKRAHTYYLDLPAGCAAGGQLCVRVANGGDCALALGALYANASTLDPHRMLANAHRLEGYASAVSVHAGAALTLFVHAPLRSFSLRVLRFGAAVETLYAADALAGAPQSYPANAFEAGAGWQPTFELAVQADWPGGLYAARLLDASGARFDITFIVKRAAGAVPAALAVLASTNTWQAYNRWAGASFYNYDIDDGLARADVYLLHGARPNPAASMEHSAGHLAGAERHLLAWLESEGIDYDLYADADLHAAPTLLLAHRALALNTHSEYWSAPMRDGLDAFLAAGGNLAYLSGNGLYWKVALRGAQIEVRHDGSRHTLVDEQAGASAPVLVDESGGRWRDHGRPEAHVLGVRFTRAGYMSPFEPYRVLAPAHWVFEGTGVRKGSLVGKPGASGWELDKIDPRARPVGLVHLAKGRNRRGTGADMCYFTHAGGGGVFSVGSIAFTRCLAGDAQMRRALRNVMARFVGPLPA